MAKDVSAGTVLGLVSVPDGLASGLLAGVNPIAGLYGYLFGTLAGAMATSSAVMSVQGTGAMAVVIADVPQVRGGPDAGAALVTLGVLTGLAMLAAGLLRLGTFVRFVPNAVLTGFVNAVAVNIILAQLSDFTGYEGEGDNRIARTVDTLLNVGSFHWLTLAAGVGTVVLILVLERTRLRGLGMVVAVVGMSALVAALGERGVAIVNDVATIPGSLPRPVLPTLELVSVLLVPAVALAFVGLVQGAAISQSVPNPDGTYPDVSGDFRGQGVANLASGIMQGVPVGGSMSATSMVVEAGARSRLANIIASVVMAVVILLFADLAGMIAMPALAGLLILVGFRTLQPDRVHMVWRTGRTQAAVMSTTFVLTLVIPLQYAVLAGVAVSVVLYVARQSNKVTVTRWTFPEDSPYPQEGPPPATVPGGEIVVLTAYGSLFFASAQVVEAQLPQVVESSRGAVVVLRLRGKEDLGSTFIQAVIRYHDALEAAGAHLVLAGVGDRVMHQLVRTGALETLGRGNVFAAETSVGKSLQAAITHAQGLRESAG
ncbi:MAG: SulP family inorganic anion transporter [Nocardioides sp.]